MLLLICQLPNGKMTHIQYSSSVQCYMINFNGLPDRLNLMCKIFADDTLFFSKANDKSDSNSQLNPDLTKISKWSFQWKMSFNPDPNKQAIEVCFSNKRDKGKTLLCILIVQTPGQRIVRKTQVWYQTISNSF